MHRLDLPEGIKVVISRSRAAGVKLIERESLADVVVLDDGMQHRSLARDLNILVLDVTDASGIARWKDGRLLPAGWLREPLQSALGRAGCVVFVQRGSAPHSAELPQLSEKVPQLNFRLTPGDFVALGAAESLPLEMLHGKKVTAFSAIAVPEQFFEMLRTLGLDLVIQRAFADHHHFTEPELRELCAAGHPLVCTEKDAVKLRTFAALPQGCYALRLKGSFTSAGGEQGFKALLSQRIRK